MTSSPARTFFSGLLSVVSVCGFLAFFTLLLSPAAVSHLDVWTTHPQTLPARVQSCTLIRNGDLRQNEVRCMVAYTVDGQQYVSPATAWQGSSPFYTRAFLDRKLAAQLRNTERVVHVRHYAPHHPELEDDRWITAPPTWLVIGLLFVACLAVVISLVPSRVQHRSDMVYQHDEATGRQVLVNAPGTAAKGTVRTCLQCAALGFAAVLCVYGLMNRPANALESAGLTDLQPVPAQLVDCQHRWTGTTKGHDEIRCGVRYTFNSVPFTGRAESIDYGLFPTNSRRTAQVARLMQSPARVAHVDPQHPEFVLAYVDNAWIAPYSLGLSEGIRALFLLLPFLLKNIVSAKECSSLGLALARLCGRDAIDGVAQR